LFSAPGCPGVQSGHQRSITSGLGIDAVRGIRTHKFP